jgi:transcriptional regulator with XRE-family HTH domain
LYVFAERLKMLRKEAGLNQTELGKELNKTKNNISQYESGKRSPDLETLKKIADLFQTTTDYLLGRTDHPRGRLVTVEELEQFLPARVARDLSLELYVDDKPMELTEETKEQIREVLKIRGLLD